METTSQMQAATLKTQASKICTSMALQVVFEYQA